MTAKYLLPISLLIVALAFISCGKEKVPESQRSVELEQILAKPLPSQEEVNRVKKEASLVLDKIKSGKTDIGEMAKLYSSHASAERGGELTITPGWMHQDFDEAVEALKDGELSEPIVTPSAVYIVQRISSKYLQVRTSHILFKTFKEKPGDTDDKATIEGARKKAWEIYRRLKSGESFYDLAKEYSQDPASSANGGDMGWTKRNFLDRDYEKVAFAQEPGEISEPVKTRYGYHIIRTVKKKDHSIDIKMIEFEIPVSTADRDRARQVMEEIRKQALSGRPFEQLSETFADNGHAELKYSSPYAVRFNMLLPELKAEFEEMDEGDITPITQNDKVYNIVKLVKK